VLAAAFHPGGRKVVTASKDGTARIWEVPGPVPGVKKRIVLWVHVITGKELDAGGAAHLLDGKAWQQRRRRLAELGGPPLP
jgi:hypothetical protein